MNNEEKDQSAVVGERISQAVTENALYFRDRSHWAVDSLNKAHDSLSQYLSLISQISIAIIPLLPSGYIQTSNSVDLAVVIVFLLLQVGSIFIGLWEKYAVVNFWRGESSILADNTTNWMSVRNKLSKPTAELVTLYQQANAYDDGLKRNHKLSSPIWLVYMQTALTTLGLVIGILFVIHKLPATPTESLNQTVTPTPISTTVPASPTTAK